MFMAPFVNKLHKEMVGANKIFFGYRDSTFELPLVTAKTRRCALPLNHFFVSGNKCFTATVV